MARRSNPFDDIDRLFGRLNRQLEAMAREWDRTWGFDRSPGTRMGVDVIDAGDEFVVTADVPGFEKDELDLRIRDTTLLITADHEQREEEEEMGRYLQSERRRSISGSVALPEPIVEERSSAAYNNGVLTVHLPKQEPTGTGGKHIDID